MTSESKRSFLRINALFEENMYIAREIILSSDWRKKGCNTNPLLLIGLSYFFYQSYFNFKKDFI